MVGITRSKVIFQRPGQGPLSSGAVSRVAWHQSEKSRVVTDAEGVVWK